MTRKSNLQLLVGSPQNNDRRTPVVATSHSALHWSTVPFRSPNSLRASWERPYPGFPAARNNSCFHVSLTPLRKHLLSRRGYGNTGTVSCSMGVINCLVRQQFIYTRLLLVICGPCCHKSRSLALQMSAALSFAGHFRSDWKSVQNGDGVGGQVLAGGTKWGRRSVWLSGGGLLRRPWSPGIENIRRQLLVPATRR